MTDNLFNSGIRPAFDKYILDKAKEKRDYGDYWSASSAGYCQRKVIFDRLGVPPVETEDDARKQRVFEMGHVVHETMQRITKEAGLSIASEVELINDKLMIKGHFDDLVMVENKLILYDYKSVNSQSFKYKKDKLSRYHEMQLGTYLYMIRKLQKQDEKPAWLDNLPLVEEARILNISKDDWRMSEAQLLWSPQLEKKVFEYWSTLNGYWKNKKIPKCTCADYEGGFMAQEKWNPYYYEGEPCSTAWLKKWRLEQSSKEEQSENKR